VNLEFSDKYEPLFKRLYEDSNIDTFILTGGRFSAKSFTTSVFSGISLKDFQYKILYTRYTLTSAQDSIIPEFLGGLESLNITEEFEVNRDRVKHFNNGEVVFKGMKTSSGNQTAALKSLKGFNCLIVDEAEEMPSQKDFEKIQLSIRHPSKPNISILILNPTTKEHWIYKKFFEDRGVNGGFNGVKDNVCYIHTSYLDCIEHVPDNILLEFERMKATKPKEYNNVVLGGWLAKAEGVIFENWTTGDFDLSLPYMYGVDWGFSKDPSTLVKVAVDEKTKTLYLEEKLYAHKMSTEQLTAVFKDVCGESIIVADNSELRLINEIRRENLNIYPVVKKPNSILAGIKKIQGYNMVICGDSPNLIKELNNYSWVDKGLKSVPIDAHNHILDAVRYSLTRLIP
jgi:phage terminase large subunit